jgi:Uma2 family endonuclease
MSPATAQPYPPVVPAGPVPAVPPVPFATGSASPGAAGGPTKGPEFPERFRFSVDLYESMTASGILGENDKVELIGGEILTKMPIGDPHIGTVRWLNRFFHRTVGERAVVSVQDPIRLADSEPEPDVALLRPRADFYRSGKAGAADTLLVIEVADTSEAFDRDVKGPMYARGGVAEYWLVCLGSATVEVRRGPAGDGTWRETQTLARGTMLAVAALPDITLPVAEFLPEERPST